MVTDPYFLPGYIEASAHLEGAVPEEFRFTSDLGVISHQFIRRNIENVDFDGYSDIISPYGYGGPVILECNDRTRVHELIHGFEREFAIYCAKTKTVSEFVRFHPIDAIGPLWSDVYDVDLSRSTVVTDLTGDNWYTRELSKTVRKKIRRNDGLGVSVKVYEPEDLSSFMRLYWKTMDRNEAANFYYFDETYFSILLSTLRGSLLLAEASLGETIIGSCLCLIGKNRIHIHLSGTDTEFMSYSPAVSIRRSILEWGVANGYKLVHHGGGRTSSPQDSLFQFKKGFGSMLSEFYTGRRVWDHVTYNELVLTSDNAENSGFFPAYRSR